MGISIVSGKMVGGMNVNGVMYYALFEEMYDICVYPHDPLWYCVGFGEYHDVLKQVMIGAVNQRANLTICQRPILTSRI